LHAQLDALGHIPLPPYIRRPDQASDRARYQTVFANERGSVAAPTAGLHFTEEVLADCRRAGSEIARVTLHVGLGTFQPLHVSELGEVKLHPEYFRIDEAQAAEMRGASRLIAAGTTSVRTLETAMLRGGLTAMSGDTDLFIKPGFEFQATGAMLTNFHLPQSSLLILVAAFAGREFVLDAYRHAVAAGYRFYSYGDCMLIV
jgi:S-adenosylmethionine:tRNA ribosyltransferase-isomerase